MFLTWNFRADSLAAQNHDIVDRTAYIHVFDRKVKSTCTNAAQDTLQCATRRVLRPRERLPPITTIFHWEKRVRTVHGNQTSPYVSREIQNSACDGACVARGVWRRYTFQTRVCRSFRAAFPRSRMFQTLILSTTSAPQRGMRTANKVVITVTVTHYWILISLDKLLKNLFSLENFLDDFLQRYETATESIILWGHVLVWVYVNPI